ncbi:MAG TPA: MarR family winged helix-turn-helix transcriptional regulator [Candidatus Acidoferrum sp.]|jgi:DNA-binding MarR family transcriptional regulator|nr:MarR family winged helix-turn-helix transcriptional regulator [Candidatus Acidoferrum sp.]
MNMVSLPCACANVRRAARVVTSLYDDALRDSGLRVTQFTLLQALELTGATSQGDLGAVLAIDSTTLSRSLRPLLEEGWVRMVPGSDRRVRTLELTAAGRERLAAANASWSAAQRRLRRALGSDRWNRLQEDLVAVAELATA